MTPWPSLSPDGSVVPALPSDEASSGALCLLSGQEVGAVVEGSLRVPRRVLPAACV